jgi:N-acetylmuramoyl-L-alanine amidase
MISITDQHFVSKLTKWLDLHEFKKECYGCIEKTNMDLISEDEARAKLADYNILLKYMVFLQNNGFSDCGKGQILGQASLLQEYLKKEGQNLSRSLEKEKEQQKQVERQMNITNDTDHEASLKNTTNAHKPGLLREVGYIIDRAKEIKI